MLIPPTCEQESIINEELNCVVIAKPGSGKTFTLAQKIKTVLPPLPDYKGVIAISYTNKASDELERRCLATGVDRKCSFFGTIDKFFMTEILLPFGERIFGYPEHEISVIKSVDLDAAQTHKYDSLAGIAYLRALYLDGYLLLESIDVLAMHVFESSQACRRYIKARYTHVIVDEYQDCGEWQHKLFIQLVQLGLIGVAVGDLDQSIFAFSGKDPKYLSDLAQNATLFKTYSLSENHRCHKSIVNYSTRLLAPSYQPIATDSTNVFEKCHLF